MKLLGLNLRGSIGIKKGLGVDQVEIDFTQFQPGLIALTGKNGCGKTTIMENLHPYRTMVSRDGSLQSHFFLKDSYRILIFEHQGSIYESKILIDALTGGCEAYLLQFQKGGESFVPLNDGKLTTYDEAIEKVLGTQELFFNSVFSGQKSKGIAELKAADRRKLFYELLNLNVYEEYLEKAKIELRRSENELAAVEGQISALSETKDLEVLLQRQKLVTDNIKRLTSEIAQAEKEIDTQLKEIQSLEIDLSKCQDKVNANKELQSSIDQLLGQMKQEECSRESKIRKYNQEIEECEKLLLRYSRIVENADVIKEKIVRKKELQGLLSKKYQEQNQANEDYKLLKNKSVNESDHLKSVESEYNKVTFDKQSKMSQQDSIKREIEKFNKDYQIISTVPCTKEIGTDCRFLKNAYNAKFQMPALHDELDLLDKSIIEISTLQNDLEYRISVIKESVDSHNELCRKQENVLNGISGEIRVLDRELQDILSRKYDELANELQQAEKEISSLNITINKTHELIQQVKNSSDSSVESMRKNIEEKKLQIDEHANSKVRLLTDDLYNSNHKLNNLKNNLATLKKDLDNETGYLAYIESDIKVIKENVAKVEDLKISKARIHQEIKEWAFLVKAFDKTGIPVLKLENSGIEITSVANDLLSLFDNKFRIVFETTSPTKDKKKTKETFDINIVEDDGVCEIGNKSGGQQVWLETAIQLAISLVVRKQGRNIQTSYLDEKDGALDLDNAVSYIQMLRQAHDMSGVHNTFIITHRTELLDFIPQQLRLQNGTLQIINN